MNRDWIEKQEACMCCSSRCEHVLPTISTLAIQCEISFLVIYMYQFCFYDGTLLLREIVL